MGKSTKFIVTALVLTILAPIVVKGQTCGCDACTQEILDRYSGFEPNRYKCGGRIQYLQDHHDYSELEACSKVAGQEFPYICGPECDPARCNATPSPAGITPYPTFNPDPFKPDLYCFPSEPNRVTYGNVWSDFKVQVKEGYCGPGPNNFSRDTVSRSGNDITLEYKYVAGLWRAGEVRVVRTDGEPFTYGKYSFHVKSIHVLDGGNNILSDVLPKDLVLGLFTWDPQDRFIDGGKSENHMHEVDVEISRWGQDIPDAQYLMQPDGSPQKFRFFTGPDGTTTFDQQDQWYAFEWLPTSVYWTSSAGGGAQTHLYTTEDAVKEGRRDLVQCLPAFVEVRLNLWSIDRTRPDGITDDSQFVRVVISDFTYEESDITHANPGDYCSKHCQCEGDCINSICEEVVVTAPPSSPPSPLPSQNPTLLPTSMPSNAPSGTPSSLCSNSPLVFIYNENKRKCAWVGKKIGKRCQNRRIESHCPNTCESCDSYGMADSKLTFIFARTERDCAWLRGLGKRQRKKKCRAKSNSLANTCRATCAPFVEQVNGGMRTTS